LSIDDFHLDPGSWWYFLKFLPSILFVYVTFTWESPQHLLIMVIEKKKSSTQLGDVVFDVLQNSQNWFKRNVSLSVRIITLLNFLDSK